MEILAPSERILARVVIEERQGPEVSVRVFISDDEPEILISDMAIDALGVEIKSPGKGLWRFADEEEIRHSAAYQIW